MKRLCQRTYCASHKKGGASHEPVSIHISHTDQDWTERTADDNTSSAARESAQPRQASVMLWP